MPLYVYRDKCKNFNKKDFDHKECDHMGFLLVGLGVKEIKKSNIKELVFRYTFLNKVAYHRVDAQQTAADATKLFKKYIGLQINGDNLTRHKFMMNCARVLERDVEYNINWKPFHRIEQPKEASLN